MENKELRLIGIELAKRNVPGEGVTWDRIQIYAQDKAFYDKQATMVTTDSGEVALASLFKNLDDPVEEPKLPDAEPKVAFQKESEILGFELSEDQKKAWAKIKPWTENDEPYFVIRGFAGVGKSAMLKLLTTLPLTLYFTAPTNKATKVLAKFIGKECKTTFSQLGLRMNSDDEKLVMEYGADAPYFPRGSILVVDEASMVGHELFKFIDEVREKSDVKILYTGDPVQLPPVGEKTSKSWKSVNKNKNLAILKKVMRYDNQVLTLATRIREQMKVKDYSFPILDDNDGISGVFLEHKMDFKRRIRNLNSPDMFTKNKIIAWRNKTVNKYNDMVRENLGFNDPFNIDDVILLAEPLEVDDQIVAHIDDEFKVYSIHDTEIKTNGGRYINVYALGVENEEGRHILNVPKDYSDLDELLNEKAAFAKTRKGFDKKEAWHDFWQTKKMFMKTRFGYAITAHRAQGSTYENCYVESRDILINQNHSEAFRCLYVAVTRPSQSVFTF